VSMSRNMAAKILGGFVVLLAAGCLVDPGGGGGGGGGTITFNSGYVFVRDDEIYIADSSDYQEASALTEDGGNKQPSLSADGKQVVYVQVVSGVPSIRAIATSGTGSARTLFTPADGERNFRTPVFSPAGTVVVFAYDDAGGTSRLASVAADGSGGFTTFTADSLSYASPSFYADGEHVLAMAGAAPNYSQLEKVNIVTGAVTPVASSLGGDAAQIVNRVALSPDESTVVFDARLVTGGTGVSRIFVKDITQAVTDPVMLTDHLEDPGALDTFPCWVSNTRVSFSSNSGGNDNIYEINTSVTSPSGGSLVVGSAREGFFL